MRSARLLALALALTPLAIHAQELPSSLGAVQGTLLAADTKQPILEASVWLQPSTPGAPSSAAPPDSASSSDSVSQNAVKTDPAGRFLIPRVKPGSYYVLFTAQGYISDRDFIPPAGALSTLSPLPAFVQKVTVTPGKTADVSLSLHRGGAIEGAVHYANGSPGYQESAGQPAGLPVYLGVRRPDGTFARLPTPARTDAQGHFRIPDVPAGSYFVFVPQPGASAESAPSPTRPANAKAAVVRGTATTSGIDITLPGPGSTR